jgi:hypothetical protein
MNKKHIFRFGFVLLFLAFVFDTYSQAVWVEDFNSLTPGSNWNGRQGQVIMGNGGVNNSQCVRVEYDIRQDPQGTTVRQWKQEIPPALEYTLQYDLYFESNWNNSFGGKFHGFSPQTHVTGCNDVQPHTWSARMVLRNRGPRLYLYHQDKGPGCGTSVNSNMQLAKERWYSVSYYLKVNSMADQSDGIVELYIDGELVVSKGNMKFYAVDGDHTKITDFFFSTFLIRNSTGPVVRREYMRYDNFAVIPGRVIRESPGSNDDFVPGNILSLEFDASRGSVIKSPDKTVYDEGEEVVLTAEPKPGFRFSNWTGNINSNENPLTVKMDSTIVLTANFVPVYTVTISENTVNGTVEVSPVKDYYEEADTITFVPYPAPGYIFNSWYSDGGIGGNVVPLVISIRNDLELNAYFNLLTYQLFTTAYDGVITRKPHSLVYAAGTDVELSAIPNAGYVFSGWSGYITGEENPITVTMDSVLNVTANFEPITSVAELTGGKPKVYPNPSQGVFTVESDQRSEYAVYTLSGVRLFKGVGHGNFEIDLKGYGRGIYLLEIKSEDRVLYMNISLK